MSTGSPSLHLAICLYLNSWFSVLYSVAEVIMFIYKGIFLHAYLCHSIFPSCAIGQWCIFFFEKFLRLPCRFFVSLSSVCVHIGVRIFSALHARWISANIFGFVALVGVAVGSCQPYKHNTSCTPNTFLLICRARQLLDCFCQFRAPSPAEFHLLGNKGNMTQEVMPIVMSMIATVLIIPLLIYYLYYQTYV